jgi:hypothetical protein
LVFTFLISLLAHGQSRTSAIGGEVLDPSGNPVPGAEITVRDLDRGISRTVSSGTSGDYLVLKLELGRYEVQVNHPGFSPVTLTGLQLTLDSEIRLVHKLVIGTDHATVSVTAETVSVDATASAVSGLIDRAKIVELPLIGRDFLQLALLRPGVHTARAQSQDGNNGFGMPLSISGSRPMQNSVRLDGANLTNQTGATPGSLLGVNLGVDAIQEFSVLSSSFGATTGRAAGGVIHAVTRSGGNDLHGSLFYFHRDSALAASSSAARHRGRSAATRHSSSPMPRD